MRIGVIHATLNAVAPLEKAIREISPSAEVCNFVNEELLYHANRAGGVDDWGLRNFMRLTMQAAESSVDGIIIACSLYSTYAEQARMLTEKPVIAIDQPMMELAVRTGTHIGILATTASSGPAAERKLIKQAETMQKTITTKIGINTEAMQALKSGDRKRHDELLKETGLSLIKAGCDALVLSQITMASAAEGLKTYGIPVLSSPQTGAEAIISCLTKSNKE
ncbi:MAG: aspartate/glutamate racemase family protein [Lachnospiraceae bacterium]|nr:aspartate/glutamate racemase family protein [Lachnospiraceae bacterium]